MTLVPNLYLKWDFFRWLVGTAQSDAQIARHVFRVRFGANDINVGNRPSLFSKMLKGEYGLQSDIAGELTKMMNASIEVYRGEHDLPGRSPQPLKPDDLFGPVYDFARHLIAAMGKAEPDALARTHKRLVEELALQGDTEATATLSVKRFEADKFIGAGKPSGGAQDPGPVIFDPGRHIAQLSIEGLAREPVWAYAMFVRDPTPEKWAWDFNWGQTVEWIPSPFKPIQAGKAWNLLPAPDRLKPVEGRFLVTAVAVLEPDVLGELDPRPGAVPGILKEEETARFLTEVRRLSRRRDSPIALATSSYRIVKPGSM